MTDSSVLLGLYQYPPGTLAQFFHVIEALGERLWIPHQVGLEFQRNRQGRIPEQRVVLEELIKRVDGASHDLEQVGLPEYHPVLDRAEFDRRQTEAAVALDSLGQLVRETLVSIPERTPEDLLFRDDLFDRITTIFEGKVGPPFTEDQLDNLYQEGMRRYERQIPPGFRDIDKEVPRRYGDLIMWKQILDKAAGRDGAAPRPTLLVTGERKEDWWRRREAAFIGPRTELIREYADVVSDLFYMYRPDEFLEQAGTYLKLEVSQETIEDVRRISSASPVSTILRSQRMVMPESGIRIAALRHIYDAIASGKVRVADDLNRVIAELGGSFTSSYVATPLFFALVHMIYGPIRVETDPSKRLRDRHITQVRGSDSIETFLTLAQSAWIAQALYRLRLERLPDEDLLGAFFGGDIEPEADSLLHRAQELVAEELGTA